VSRYDDIVAIERDKATFSNVGDGRSGYRPNIPADRSIIGLDDPHHVLRRNVVSRRFTPRAVGRWEDHVQATVTSLIDNALGAPATDGTCRVEAISQLAAPLPAQMIGLLLGFGADMWPKLRNGPNAPSPWVAAPATTTRRASKPPWSSPEHAPISTRPSSPPLPRAARWTT
jgi:cytochrome P450 family 142 subfamily A polypeptide 1